MKRITIGSKFYRIRRGKLVEIPTEWVGNVTNPQTMRKRRIKPDKKQAKHQRLRKRNNNFKV